MSHTVSKATARRNMLRTIIGLGLLTAIVVVLQFIGATIRFGTFSVSLVLMPIVIGAALFGPWAGAWLGLVFDIVVLLSGDAATFMTINPFGTIVTVIVKGVLAGYVSGLVYSGLAKLFSKDIRTERFATIASFILMILGGGALLYNGCRLNSSPEAIEARENLRALRSMAKTGADVEIPREMVSAAFEVTRRTASSREQIVRSRARRKNSVIAP